MQPGDVAVRRDVGLMDDAAVWKVLGDRIEVTLPGVSTYVGGIGGWNEVCCIDCCCWGVDWGADWGVGWGAG